MHVSHIGPHKAEIHGCRVGLCECTRRDSFSLMLTTTSCQYRRYPNRRGIPSCYREEIRGVSGGLFQALYHDGIPKF